MYSKNDIYELHVGIQSIKARIKEKMIDKFSYALSINSRRIKDIIESISDQRKEILGDYDKEHNEIAKKHSETDEKGNPIMRAGGYNIQKHMHAYLEEKKALDEKYKDSIDRFEKTMKEDAGDVKLHMVKEMPDMPFDLADAIYLIREEPENTESNKSKES